MLSGGGVLVLVLPPPLRPEGAVHMAEENHDDAADTEFRTRVMPNEDVEFEGTTTGANNVVGGGSATGGATGGTPRYRAMYTTLTV